MRRVEDLLGQDGSLTRTLHDVAASDDHAVTLVSVYARRSDGRTAHWNAALVMHIEDGKINEVWVTIEDPYVVDEFLS